MDSRKSATREISCTGAEIPVGVDLDQDLDGDDGKYWLKTQRSKGGSRMLLYFNHCLFIA
jgi:hypothetical protein